MATAMFGALRAPARRATFTNLASCSKARSVATRGFATSRAVRNAAPEQPKSSNNSTLFIGLGALVAGGAAYYFLTSDSDAAKAAASGAKGAAQVAKVAANFVPTKADYDKVYAKIADSLDAEDYDDGSYGPLLLRLAWHSSGTYDKETGTGGSNYATMRFEPEALHGANNGLAIARGVMEQIKKEFPWISYGDLWTLGGVVAVQELGGPKIPWRPGRIDGFAKDATPDGRLPDAAQGQDHVRNIFYRMGFNDQEIVALAGAHALGRCHTDRSGFDGPWTFSPVSFSNSYFDLLANEKWIWRKWDGPKQLTDKKTGTLMMLPADYALVQDKAFKKHVQAYAKDEALFFKDFSSAFGRMLELGVPTKQFVASEPWIMGEAEKKD
ncbi:cytochrome c peroxidase [Auriculariales sp. MPI-PUGE-AT-0066]|nr:cytochrome c peroxidase [Auriculariales sp. MPI-PUGE-AT-0066]